MTNGPSGGDIVAGVVLILFGLCILLVGGGCTIFWLMLMLDRSSWGGSDGPGLLLVSLVAAAAGLFAIVKGVQMLRRKGG